VSKHPPLKDLGEYASGSLDEARTAEITEHVEACQACSDKVEAARKLDSTLRAGLQALDRQAPPADCLPPSMMADYFDDELSPERRSSAERHLADCPDCRANLVEMQRALEERREGELAGLEEKVRRRALDLVGPEVGEQWPKCPSCGGKVGAGASECPACGVRPRPEAIALICMACRNAIPIGSRFCPLCGVAIAPPKKSLAFLLARKQNFSELLRAHIWFILSVAAMAASFYFRKYFQQCIAIAVIFGAKWILDQAQFRIYGEILKSLKKDAEPEKSPKPRKRKIR
jgi:uncharacterized protein YbaR (Trm112 family)